MLCKHDACLFEHKETNNGSKNIITKQLRDGLFPKEDFAIKTLW